MLAISQVTNPRLEAGGIVLLDRRAVRLDRRLAADRRPFARRRQEGDVDVRVVLQIVRLARLRVGVEEKVETVRFLQAGSAPGH